MTQPFGQKSVFRSVLLMTSATYVTYAVGLVVSTIIARTLGPADFGRYSYMVWLSGILIIFSTNGLTASGMRFVSECIGRGDVASARNVNGWLLKRHYVSLLIVSILFAFAVPFVEPAGWQGHLWTFGVIALASAVTKADFLFRSSIAKGYGVFTVEANTTNLMALGSLTGVALLAWLRQPLISYLLLFLVLSAGHSVLAHVFVRRRNLEPTFDPVETDLAQRMQRHFGWSVAFMIIAAFSNKSIETFLLNETAGAEAVGFFTIAAALTRGGIDLLSSGLNSVLLPMMAHAFGSGGVEQANGILAHSVRYFLCMGLFVAGVGSLWAGPIISTMYGAAYASAIPVLIVMIIVGGVALADGAFGAMLSITDRQNLRVAAAMFYIVITATAAIALVPKYGLVGAVIAHAISRTTSCIAVGIVVVRSLHVTLPYGEIGRLFLAALIGAAAAGSVLLIAHGRIAEFAAGVVYAIVYLAATLPLRIWHEQDVRVMSAIAARVPGLRTLPSWLLRMLRAG